MRLSLRAPGPLYLLAALLVLGVAACEDDPILEPTSGGTKGGGSYGKISLPETAPAASDRANMNPELF